MTVEHEIVIERPVDVVFAYVADPTNAPEWQADVVSTTKASDEPMGTGVRWREVRNFLGRRIQGTLEATEYEPDRLFALETVSGTVALKVRHLFEPFDGGTRIRVLAEGHPGRLGRLGGRFVRRAAERQLKADFARLKELLEGGQERGAEAPRPFDVV
jgi:uncharacterized membrane protein